MILLRAQQALLQIDSDEMCLLRTDNTTLIAPSRAAITLLSVVVSVKQTMDVHQTHHHYV